jgi:hypothetical protein
MDSWRELTLAEAGVELIDCLHKTPPKRETGLPYVAIPEMRAGELDLTSARKISDEDFEEWTKKAKPEAFDVVLSRRCNPGETAFVRPGMQFALGQNLVLLRSNGDRIYPPFLRWVAKSPQWWEQVDTFLNVGAVFDSLRCADVPKFRVPVPEKAEQVAISTLLGALDDKIELNRQTNETLEALARAIFKDWFVDFGPTRAKAEGRAAYLAPALSDLFPDRLDAEGKPEGWTREHIGEHVKAAKGLSYKGSGLTTADSGMPLHNLNSVLEGGGYKTDGLKFYAGDYRPKHTVRPGDLIVANTEQGFDHLLIGYSAIVPRWTGNEALFSHHLYRVEPLSVSPLSRIWLHFALSASWIGDVVRRFSNGSQYAPGGRFRTSRDHGTQYGDRPGVRWPSGAAVEPA